MENQVMLTKKERREIKRQTRENERARQISARKTKKNITKGLVLFIIIVAVFGLWKLSQRSTPPPLAIADLLQTQSDDWTKGNIDSTVTLVEYLDFECEACGAYYPLVKRISEEYNEDILFISRYFPLSGHANGMPSALAVESAGKQGKYWEMHNLLFEEQQNWGERSFPDSTIFEKYAEQLGLNMEQFKRDASSQEVRDRVIGDRNSGNQLGVNSTPTFFLDGKKIQNPRGYEAFKSLINDALEK